MTSQRQRQTSRHGKGGREGRGGKGKEGEGGGGGKGKVGGDGRGDGRGGEGKGGRQAVTERSDVLSSIRHVRFTITIQPCSHII